MRVDTALLQTSIPKRKRQRTGESALHIRGKAEKATLISERGLYFMPARTYSPTHFRVQYNRPCEVILMGDSNKRLVWTGVFALVVMAATAFAWAHRGTPMV